MPPVLKTINHISNVTDDITTYGETKPPQTAPQRQETKAGEA
jgi:hypothetical protein